MLNESSGNVTRCPCVGKGQQCTKRCRCLNAKKRMPKCTSSPSLLKRRGEEYMSERKMKVSVGSWTTTEYCILDAVESFLHSTCLLPSEDNITHLYNYVVRSRFARELKLTANEKILKQVKGKLTFEEERYRATVQLTHGVEASP